MGRKVRGEAGADGLVFVAADGAAAAGVEAFVGRELEGGRALDGAERAAHRDDGAPWWAAEQGAWVEVGRAAELQDGEVRAGVAAAAGGEGRGRRDGQGGLHAMGGLEQAFGTGGVVFEAERERGQRVVARDGLLEDAGALSLDAGGDRQVGGDPPREGDAGDDGGAVVGVEVLLDALERDGDGLVADEDVRAGEGGGDVVALAPAGRAAELGDGGAEIELLGVSEQVAVGEGEAGAGAEVGRVGGGGADDVAGALDDVDGDGQLAGRVESGCGAEADGGDTPWAARSWRRLRSSWGRRGRLGGSAGGGGRRIRRRARGPRRRWGRGRRGGRDRWSRRRRACGWPGRGWRPGRRPWRARDRCRGGFEEAGAGGEDVGGADRGAGLEGEDGAELGEGGTVERAAGRAGEAEAAEMGERAGVMAMSTGTGVVAASRAAGRAGSSIGRPAMRMVMVGS